MLHQFDMTDDEIKEAKWAAKTVAQHLDGIKLQEALRIGSILMKGRQYAMRVAGVNKPQGKNYAEALMEWKQGFKFREDKDAKAYYDHAIVCAQHRTIADDIVAGLSGKQRAEIGAAGLAARVRAKLRELEGVPKPVRITPASRLEDLAGELADIRAQVTALNPKNTLELVTLLSKRQLVEVVEAFRVIDPNLLDRLVAARDVG
jgi:hypothetical protein